MKLVRNSAVAIVAAALCTLPTLAFADGGPSAAIVRPLREIGRVRATTSFCTAFSLGAAPAARAALAYESRLALTLSDLATYDASDELAKQRGIVTLEDDLRALADASQAGRAELAALRASALANGSESNDAVVAFADALDGAKGRQMTLARRIARTVGTLAEQQVFSVVNTPDDNHSLAAAFGHSPATRSALIEGVDVSPRIEDAYFTVPGDDAIGRDLAAAVEHASVVQAHEHCT